MAGRTCEIRVAGSLGPAACEAFNDVAIKVEPTATVLCGDLDQAHLHALLDRVRALGLELVDIRQIPRLVTGLGGNGRSRSARLPATRRPMRSAADGQGPGGRACSTPEVRATMRGRSL